jgi:hypothetical protein
MKFLFSLTIMLFMPIFLIAETEQFSLKETSNSIVVNNNGIIFSVNKKTAPHWGKNSVFSIGKPEEKNSLELILGTENPMKNLPAPLQLLPNSKGGSFRILENTADCKQIRAEYTVSPTKNSKLIHPDGKLVMYMTVLNGIPGARLNIRFVSHAECLVVYALNCIFGSNFENLALDGKNKFKYQTGKYTKIKGKRNYIIAEKNSHRYFIDHVNTRHPKRGVVIISEANKYNKPKLPRNDSCDINLTIGIAQNKAAERKLLSLKQLVTPPREPATAEYPLKNGKMLAIPLTKNINWEEIPFTARVSGVANYRPRTSNTWESDKDLSFDVKTAYNSNYFFVKVKVKDDVFEQKSTGDGIWSGDCVQIGFDPLNAQAATKNYIEIGMTASKTPTLWCWQHPNPKFVGDLTNEFKMSSKRTAEGHEYLLALPWEFLKPFVLQREKLGFNVVVLDADGTGIENWMGITDGIAGGKDPGLFHKLYFYAPGKILAKRFKKPQIELILKRHTLLDNEKIILGVSAFCPAKILPAALNVNLPDGKIYKYKLARGFNNFEINLDSSTFNPGPCKINAAIISKNAVVSKQHTEIKNLTVKYISGLTDFAEKKLNKLTDFISRIRKEKKINPSYLESGETLAKYFIDMVRLEINRDSIFRAPSIGAKRKMIKTQTGYKCFIFERAYKNITSLNKRLDKQLADAKAMLKGKMRIATVPDVPRGERPVIADGGFKIGGRELFLLGPNTWCFHYTQLPLIAKSGMNFFDIFARRGNTIVEKDEKFRVPETYDWHFNKHIVTESEKHGLFFFGRFWHGNGHCNADKDFQKMKNEAEKQFGVNRYLSQSPAMVYVVTQQEGFHKDSNIPRLEKDFIAALKRKFHDVKGMNRKLGTKYNSFEDFRRKDINFIPALKYEYFCFESNRNIAALKRFNDFKRKLWKIPLSTHFSELHFSPWDTYLNSADYERIWNEFEVIGWDGGINPISRRWAMNWSIGEIIFCDMARSLYPEKPITNNENHTIPGQFGEVTEEFAYASAILPYLHGRNAGVLWLWEIDFHNPWGSYHFTRENAFSAVTRAALDLQRFSEEIAAFRRQSTPFAILYSLPSLQDSQYLKYLINVYEGCYFNGFPVKFVTERSILKNTLKKYQLLIVPGAPNVSSKVFKKIENFSKLPNRRVIRFLGKSLSADQYGHKVTTRSKALAKMKIFDSTVPEKVHLIIKNILAKMKIYPEVKLLDENGEQVFGVEYRIAHGKSGEKLLYIINLDKKQRKVYVKSDSRLWQNLIGGETIPSDIILKPLDFLLLKAKK